ncbi:MAG: glycosyltransferase family 4 protein [Pontiellaceae bacterium]|nr:glycosyltransferase family 4 protein [Pontiellaceae bacterium]
MKVVHIIPGSGGTFYCQNCMRDMAMIQSLRKQGCDVVMVPMYLPMFTDGNDAQEGMPVFFGGINVWLQQALPFFRHTPRWLDRLFDSGWMLRRAARMEGTTSAGDLGPMTLSMLEGADGNQRKEVERLVSWLQEHERPDLVHISNALLIGLAPEIRSTLNVPVVCTLQDEDWWLDEIRPPHDDACWEAIRERTQYVDRFVAVSHWFAEEMEGRLGLSPDQVDVVHVGIDLDGYGTASLDLDTPVLGYLSRMNDELGLPRLVDAFIELKQVPGLERLKLRATGGAVGEDLMCVERQRRRLEQAGWADDVEFLEDFGREHRLRFLETLSVMCVPVEKGEAFGTYIIEAMASGVPVVQPDAGAFPELIEATGGGVIYHDLRQTLQELLLDPERLRTLGARGRRAVHESFGIDTMSQNLIELYNRVLEAP